MPASRSPVDIGRRLALEMYTVPIFRAALAERLRVTRQATSNLLNGNAGLSAEMAIRFEKGFGVKADTLMRMQAAHELARARPTEDNVVVAGV